MNGRKFNQAVFERNDGKKKTGNHIRTHMNFGRTLTRYSLRIFVFHFSFFSFFYRNSRWKCSFVFLENAVKYCVFLGPNIDRRENTSIASSRISTSFLIIFSVIFLMSSWTLLSDKQRLNLCTSCAINFLAIPTTFSKINYGNTSQIFQSIICLNDR